jgi:hypothetical protein
MILSFARAPLLEGLSEVKRSGRIEQERKQELKGLVAIAQPEQRKASGHKQREDPEKNRSMNLTSAE